MNWSDSTMEQSALYIIGCSFFIAIAVIGKIFSNRRIDKKILSIIGSSENDKCENDTLVKQFQNLQKQHKEFEKEIEKISDVLNVLNTEVRKLVDYSIIAEVLEKRIGINQEELKNSVNQVLREWQILFKENQKLKKEHKLLMTEKIQLERAYQSKKQKKVYEETKCKE